MLLHQPLLALPHNIRVCKLVKADRLIDGKPWMARLDRLPYSVWEGDLILSFHANRREAEHTAKREALRLEELATGKIERPA